MNAPGIEAVEAVLKDQQQDLPPLIQPERVKPVVLVGQQDQQYEEEVVGLPHVEEKRRSKTSSDEDKFITIEELLGLNKHRQYQPFTASDEEGDGLAPIEELLGLNRDFR